MTFLRATLHEPIDRRSESVWRNFPLQLQVGGLGAILAPAGGVLGTTGLQLGESWGHLGSNLGGLGSILAQTWGSWGVLGTMLGGCGGHVGVVFGFMLQVCRYTKNLEKTFIFQCFFKGEGL